MRTTPRSDDDPGRTPDASVTGPELMTDYDDVFEPEPLRDGSPCPPSAWKTERRPAIPTRRGRHVFYPSAPPLPAVRDRPDTSTLAIGFVGVAVLFVPIPILTQLIGIPILLYASYRYWGNAGSEAS